MRIALAVHAYPDEAIGGTERYVARLAAALVARGHDVFVIAGSLVWRPTVAVAPFEHDGVRGVRIHRDDLYFDRWDKGHHPAVSRVFAEQLAAFRPDVLHVHHWIRLSTDLVRRAAAAGVPAVVTLHDLHPSCPRVFRLKGEDSQIACEAPLASADCVPCVPRWRFDRDDAVAANLAEYREDMLAELLAARVRLAPSAGHAAFLAKMLDLAAPIEALPHGRLAQPPARMPRTSTDGTLRVGCFGHLQPLKGAHVLLEALRLCTRRDAIEAHLYGAAVDEGYEQRLRELARGLRVVFHGAYVGSEIAGETLDAAVLPTLCRESWSFVLDEVADLGVPILASDAGALADRATPRVELFRRNDASDLASKLDRLADDPAHRAAMRSAAPPRVDSFESHVAGVESALGRAVAAGAPSGPAAGPGDPALRHFRRREQYFAELVRIERWEDVVAELRGRIADLEAELRRARGES
jgi:glycosyltransferase involved in cell wall biosynthesis